MAYEQVSLIPREIKEAGFPSARFLSEEEQTKYEEACKQFSEKSRIINLSRGIDFVGFRNFYYYRLLRKRNIKNIQRKVELLNKEEISYENFIASFQGWQAYAKWADSYKFSLRLIKSILVNRNI